MRTIDADTLLFNLNGMMAVSPTGYIHGDMVTDMINGSPTIELKQRWIPIEKELPPVYKTVLLSHRSGVTIGWYNGMSYRTNTSARYIRTVKAWMPLPEQYRGEGD